MLVYSLLSSMKIVRLLLIIILIPNPLLVVAQRSAIDSVLRIITAHKDDSIGVNALNELGTLYYQKGDHDSSILAHRKALSIANLYGYRHQIYDAYQGISLSLLWQAKYDSAKLYLLKAEFSAKENKDYSSLATIYNSLGNIFVQEGNKAEALKNYIQTAKIQDSILHDPLGQSGALANIGNIQYQMGNLDKALSYARQAQEISATNSLGKNLAYTSQLTGRIYRKQKKLDEALIEYERALKQYLKMGFRREASETYLGIGNIYFDKNDFNNAQKNYKVALEISKAISNVSMLGMTYSAIGITFQNLKNYQSAILYVDSAYVAAKKINDQYTVLDAYEVLSQIYASEKKYKESLSYFQKFADLKDSLNESENKAIVEELEIRYQNEKKAAEVELLKSEQELQSVLLSKQRANLTITIVLLISVIIISTLLINRYRVMNRMKRQAELESMRQNIARDLHDDIGSTLSSINIMSQLAMKETGNSSVQLQKIAAYSSTMMESMSDMVWSISPRNDSLEQMVVKMKEFAAEILEPKNIQYDFSTDQSLGTISLDVEKRKNLFLIFKEAINNAAKYSEASNVDIHITRENGSLSMFITDNGNGFDTNNTATGNGLNNMRARAQAMKGRWQHHSEPGKGTSIAVKIPLT